MPRAGPWTVLRGRTLQASYDLRRDIGIWAGSLALLHTALGLNVHLRGHMWRYFFATLHPLVLPMNAFGLANYIGLAAALVFILLLAISNDAALRRLGLARWKSLQRWTYAVFAFTVLHGIAFWFVEKRRLPWMVIFILLGAVTLIIQGAAFARRRSRS